MGGKEAESVTRVTSVSRDEALAGRARTTLRVGRRHLKVTEAVGKVTVDTGMPARKGLHVSRPNEAQ